ncbi:hypothetical protein LSTR_LSTR005481 [Laodelphax striatellus]|uniref:Uncharacterized protein n=1 Tax=Laodelphax striatellus TaxID=195883 RepID=A0A482WYL1_LAOST|nr:hypothetical protein LSTR_LSTR005481 [Laodelphax striatellus]
MGSYVHFLLLSIAVSSYTLPTTARFSKDMDSTLPISQDLKDGEKTSTFSPDILKILAEKIMEMISKGEDISQDDLPDDLRKLLSSIESVCREDNEVKSPKDPKKSHRQGRNILESFRHSKRGRSLLNDDLQQLQPDKLDELILDIALLCDLDKQANTTREGRGMLSRLSFLTGMHFGSIFSGSGTIAATQSLHILGRIINSALSVSYGPARPEGLLGGLGGINQGLGGVGGLGGINQGLGGINQGSLIPTVPLADSVSEPPFNEVVEDHHGHRIKIKPPHHFLWDHNKRVENFNAAVVNSTANFRKGRVE